jgi:hypothetical protein
MTVPGFEENSPLQTPVLSQIPPYASPYLANAPPAEIVDNASGLCFKRPSAADSGRNTSKQKTSLWNRDKGLGYSIFNSNHWMNTQDYARLP